MRRLLFFILLSSTILPSRAQVVFCPPGAKWHYNFNMGPLGWNVIENDSIQYIRDSVLNSTTVKILMHKRFSTNCTENNYRTLIKQKGDTIFMRNYHTNHKWQILYNFAANPGSSWQDSLWFSSGMKSTYTVNVTALNTVTLNGVALKELSVMYSKQNSIVYQDKITERLGSARFLFNFFDEPSSCERSGYSAFLCYRDSSFGHLQLTNRPCDFSYGVGIDEEKPGNEKVTLFPNPATETIHVKGLDAGIYMQVVIYNSLGQAFSTETLHFENKETRINTSMLSPGIYFLKIPSYASQSFSWKFVIAR